MNIEDRPDWPERLDSMEARAEGSNGSDTLRALIRLARKMPELEASFNGALRDLDKTLVEQETLRRRFTVLAAGFQASQNLLAHYRIHSNRPPRDSVFAAIAAAKEIL